MVILTGILMSQCIKEEASLQDVQIKLNPGIGLPAVHANYLLSSIFKSEEEGIDILQANGDGILTVSYSEKVFSESASSFITFDQAIENSISIAFKKESKEQKDIAFNDTIEFKFTNYQALGIEGLLYEVKFDYAQFNLDDDAGILSETSSIIIKFPTIIKPGTTDTAYLEHVVGEENTSTLEMSGYVAKFINNANITNGLPIEFKLVTLVKSKGFNLNYSFTLIDYEHIKGYFGNFSYNLDETSLSIDFLTEVDSIDIKFEKAEFSIDFTNSFGINLDIFMDNVSATSIDGDDIVIDFLPTSNDPFQINAPDSIGDTVNRSDIYDLNDVLDLLSKNPKEISFQPVGEFNPPSAQQDTNFIQTDSRFSLNVKLDIPLKFWASVIAFQDKFAFDGSILENVTQLEYLGLLFKSSNVLPLDAKIDVTFMGNQVPLYRVGGNDGFRISSNLDADGIPIEGEPFEQIIAIDSTQFENLKQTDSLLLKITLKTTGADDALMGDTNFVAFKADATYFLDLTVKLIVEGEFVYPFE